MLGVIVIAALVPSHFELGAGGEFLSLPSQNKIAVLVPAPELRLDIGTPDWWVHLDAFATPLTLIVIAPRFAPVPFPAGGVRLVGGGEWKLGDVSLRAGGGAAGIQIADITDVFTFSPAVALVGEAGLRFRPWSWGAIDVFLDVPVTVFPAVYVSGGIGVIFTWDVRGDS
jgi:hypothetical protein